MTEMPTAPEADDEAHEPTDAEVDAWLRTQEGQASMQGVMKQVVAGEFGKVPEEMLEMARQGLKRHHSRDVLAEAKQRMANLMRGINELSPHESRWAQVRQLHEETKSLMDLLLEVHEPHRTKLMRLCLPLQQQLEDLQKNL